MKRKLVLIIIPLFIAMIIVLGIVYFLSFFQNQGKNQQNTTLDAFKSQKDAFVTKKQAYDAYLRDSTINIRKENVSIDLSALFKSNPKNSGDLIPEKKPAPTPGNTNQEISKATLTNHLYAKDGKSDHPVRKNSPVISLDQAEKGNVTLNPTMEVKTRESFFSASMEKPEDSKTKALEDQPIVYAVVHSRQSVYEGSAVKLRTTADCVITGFTIPVNTFIYGLASLGNERVIISVHSISIQDKLIPVKLEAFDKDGTEGIYVPGFAIHKAGKEGMNSIINEVSKESLPYLGNGIVNTLSQRNNQQSAILTDGYQLILK